MKKLIERSKALKKEHLKNPALRKDFIIIILFFIVFVPSSFDHNINTISLYVIIPGLFVYSLSGLTLIFRKFRFFRLFVFLFCWMLLSSIVAVDMDLYWAEIRRIFEAIMLSYILIYFCWKSPGYIYYFYLLYIFKFLYIFYYASQNGLFATDLTSERFGLDDLNANVFGYFGFFALIASFLLAINTQRLQKILYASLFCIIFILVLTTGVLAASRATLLISITAFIFLLLIRYLYPISLRSIFPLVLILISILIINKYFGGTFQNSLVKGRFEAKEDTRYYLLSKAIEVGEENIILGVGSGNFILYNSLKAFSHNSFSELFANNGILALILYVLLLVEILSSIRQYVKLGGDKKTSKYFIIIWLTYCVYNLFYVFYINPFMLTFIFLIRIHLEYLKKNLLKNKIKEKQIAI